MQDRLGCEPPNLGLGVADPHQVAVDSPHLVRDIFDRQRLLSAG